ncbi:MAG: MMPL family transporter [Propionibacteriaceae bacterium]|nr:MMPL family transporter [Propionibacteriaceae bacterium]
MEKVAGLIIGRAKLVLALFALLTVVFGLLIPLVPINYNLADYVPDRAPSTRAIAVIEEEFDDPVPNARVFIPDVNLAEATAMKDQIASLEGIESVMWLDDYVDLREPLQIQDTETVEGFLTDNGALYQVTADLGQAPEALTALQALSPDAAVEGQLVDMSLAQTGTSSEITTIMAIMLPMLVVVLLLATRSWLDPVFLLTSLGVAVALNMGTNIFLGEISFITQSVAGVLQLAVSLDYGLFLLHSRERHSRGGEDTATSLRAAVVESATAIVSASATTILGFLALVFMSFRLGPDLGIVLAKGVLFSLLCVLVLTPALYAVFARAVAATQHRSFLPSFAGLGRLLGRVAPFLLVIAALVPVAYVAQGMNDFRYTMTAYPDGSREEADRAFIEEEFGRRLPMVLLVPRGDWAREHALEQELAEVDGVVALASYQSQVGRYLPAEVLPADQVSALLSENHSRMVLTVDSPKEGDAAFGLVQRIREIAQSHYPDRYHLTGESVVTLDMRDTIREDNVVVNGLAIASVGLVLALAFRALVLPVLLVLTIEASIWFNLALPYVTGNHLAFIGYLIVSSVQLGATVDYAILVTQHYLRHRVDQTPREAVSLAVKETFGVLVVPAAVLAAAGFILASVSSLDVVSQLGTALGRGAVLSFAMVYLFLPGLLMVFDRVIEATTWKTRFLRSTP